MGTLTTIRMRETDEKRNGVTTGRAQRLLDERIRIFHIHITRETHTRNQNQYTLKKRTCLVSRHRVDHCCEIIYPWIRWIRKITFLGPSAQETSQHRTWIRFRKSGNGKRKDYVGFDIVLSSLLSLSFWLSLPSSGTLYGPAHLPCIICSPTTRPTAIGKNSRWKASGISVCVLITRTTGCLRI